MACELLAFRFVRSFVPGLGKSSPILWFKLKETAAACSQEPAVAQGPQPSPPPNSYAAQDDGNEIKPPSANVIVAVCMPMCESVRLTKCLPGYSLSLSRSQRTSPSGRLPWSRVPAGKYYYRR
jgi:hypothetical protein